MAAPNHIIQRNREEETQPSVFETRQKMAIAATMRKEGHSYPHIATTLACSRSYAEKLVRKALREIIEEDIQDLMKQELTRLDALFLPAFLAATQVDKNGNPIFNKEASDSALKLMERRAKFLGLDKPVKAEITNSFNVDQNVQIYIPDNGRGLPINTVIEDGLVKHIPITIEHEVIDLDIDDGDGIFDLSDLDDDK